MKETIERMGISGFTEGVIIATCWVVIGYLFCHW